MSDSTAFLPPDIPQGSLAAILESITDGLVVVDDAWRYRYVNRSAERLVGRPREELLGQTIWEAFPPLLNSDVEREYRRARAEGVSVHFEHYYAPLASWFDIRAYPSGQGLTIYLQVINERKAAERTLQERARQQAAVARAGLLVLRERELDCLLQEVAQTVSETLEVEYAKVLKLLPGGDDLLLQAGVGWKAGSVGSAVVSARDSSQASFTLQQQQPVIVADLPREIRFQGPPLLLEHGVVSGMSVVIEGSGAPYGILGAHTAQRRRFNEDDVNFLQAMANVLAEAVERHAVERALRASEERFRELAENIREVLWMIAPEGGELLYVNPAYESVWGRPVQTLYDDPASWQEPIHPEDRAAVQTALPALRRGDFDVEFRIVRPDGSVRWIHDRAFPVRRPDGSVVRLVGLAEDITERRQAAQSALRLAEEEAARATAQAAVRARDETLAVVSHDLRAPLQTILASSSLMQEIPLSGPEQTHHLELIQHSVERARRLLGDLVEVTNIQAGHVKLVRKTVDASRILSEVHEAFFEQARQKQVQLDCEACRAMALGDEQRLFQVLSNLVDNALKHAPPASTVTLGVSVAAGGVEFSVADTGPGIPLEEVPHVFEWHWQARRKQAAGAGIGLAVAKGIVEAHGGEIWVDTNPGRGVVVRFRIPAAPLDGGQIQAPDPGDEEALVR